MNKAAFSNLHKGTIRPGTGTSSIDLPVGIPPMQFYRHVRFMHFHTVGTAEGIRIIEDDTKLRTDFNELEFDANQKSESELIAALESIDTETVGVKLDTSREIKKAILSSDRVIESGYMLAFHDFDGLQVSGDPAAVTDVENGVAELDNPYSGSQFALRLKNTVGVALPFQPCDLLKLVGEQPGNTSLDTLDTQTRTIDLKVPRRIYRVQLTPGSSIPADSKLEFYRLDLDARAEKPTTMTDVSNHTAILSDEFIAPRFAVRIKKGDGAYLYLSDWDIEQVIVRTCPTGPRLGIANPNGLMKDGAGAPTKPDFFWQQPGEKRNVVGLQNAVEGGKMLAEALQRNLDATLESLREGSTNNGSTLHPPDRITAALIIESDAPCHFDLSVLEVGYQLISANTFTSGQDKHTLRFTGARDETQKIMMKQPVQTTVMSARLRTVESFKSQGLLTEQPDQSGDSVIFENTGAHVGLEKWAAQPIALSEALSVNGVRLGLLVLTEKTELQVQLREDWRGQPVGKQLAEGRLGPVKIGHKHWASLQFTESFDLFTQPCWLICRATSGEAVWLCRSSETNMVMLNHPDNQPTAILEGMTALFDWLIPLKPSNTEKDQSTVKLKLGDQIIVPETAENDNRIYDLTAPLNAYLQKASGGNSAAHIPLSFTAAMPGIITVYPPEIDFSINT